LWDFVSQAAGRGFHRRAALLVDILKSQAGSVVVTGFERNFEDQECIFQQDEPDDTAYLILRGKVLVQCTKEGDEGVIAQLAPGEVFTKPEDTYCRGMDATAVALEKTRLFQINEHAYRRLKRLCRRQAPGFAYVDLKDVKARRRETDRGAVSCRCLSDKATLFSCWVKEQ
jgi:CRP-like cAMP-binding protein